MSTPGRKNHECSWQDAPEHRGGCVYRGGAMEPKNQTLIVHTDTRTEHALPPDHYFHEENKSYHSTKKDYYHLL